MKVESHPFRLLLELYLLESGKELKGAVLFGGPDRPRTAQLESGKELKVDFTSLIFTATHHHLESGKELKEPPDQRLQLHIVDWNPERN